MAMATTGGERFRILCVGDVHGQWDSTDKSAILSLKPNLVLFVGDYGNESIEIVKQIGELSEKVRCAAAFGNQPRIGDVADVHQQ